MAKKQPNYKPSMDSIFGQGDCPRVFSAAARILFFGSYIAAYGGETLSTAIDTHFTCMARPNGLDSFRICLDGQNVQSFCKDDLFSYRQADTKLYAGIAYALKRAGTDVLPCDILVAKQIAQKRGLGATVAAQLGTALMLSTLSNAQIDRVELAKVASLADSDYIEGSNHYADYLARVLHKKSRMLLVGASGTYKYVPFISEDYQICLITTKSPPQQHLDAQAVLDFFRQRGKNISSICQLFPSEVNAVYEELPYASKVLYLLLENGYAKQAAEACANEDFVEFGDLLKKSFSSQLQLLGIECEATKSIATFANQSELCLGAKILCNGTIAAMLRTTDKAAFAKQIKAGFKHISFETVQSCNGLCEIV